MSNKLKEIEKLLSDNKAWWVCPITGVKFDVADVAAIEDHKKKILDAEEKKIEQKKINAAAKIIAKELQSVETLEDLNSWFKKMVMLKVKGIKEENIPELKVDPSGLKNTFPGKGFFIEVKDKKQVAVLKNIKDIGFGYADIKVQNIGKKPYLVYSRDYNNLFVLANEFGKRYNSLKVKKVGMEEKEVLNSIPKYVELRDEIKSIAKELHDLKEYHKKINSEMESIRKNSISEFNFEDFLKMNKNNSKQKKKY